MSEHDDTPKPTKQDEEEATNNEEVTKNEKVDWNEWQKITKLNEIPASLSGWNLIAALFQCFQALLLFALSSQKKDSEWFLYTNYPFSLDDDNEGLDTFRRPDQEEIAGYSVVWYSAIYILLSGIHHFVCFYFSSSYNYYLQRHQNPFRWIEYAFSASFMRIMIAQICGVTDVHCIFLIFVCSAMTMLLGNIHESVNAKARSEGAKQNWYPFLVALIPHLSSWFVIFNYFFKAVAVSDPPGSIWAIIILLFLLDNCFALLFYLQWAKIGPFKEYVAAEKEYIILSFTAKTLLAWLQYGWAS